MTKSPIVIDAVLTTLGPLSISLPKPEKTPSVGNPVDSNNVPIDPKQYNYFPIVGMSINENGAVSWTGYLPASTFRAKLRRAAGIRSAMQRGTNSTEQLYAEILGQIAGGSDKPLTFMQIAKIRQEQPILDLFGTYGVESRLKVGNFLPSRPVLPTQHSLSRGDLDAVEGALDLLSETELAVFYQRKDANSERSKQETKVKVLDRAITKLKKDALTRGGGDQGLTSEIAAKEQELRDLEQKKQQLAAAMGEGGMKNSTRQCPDYFALPIGVDLKGRMVIDRPQPADLDIIKMALDDLSLRPIVGAQSARGCGEISGKFTFRQDGVDFLQISVGDWKRARVIELDPDFVIQ